MAGLDGALAHNTGFASDELAALVRAISGQIDDADRRHTGLLQEMHQRLMSLGQEAQMMRARVPHEFAHAYARIEDGMQLLAERLQPGDNDRKMPRPLDLAVPSSHAVSAAAVEAAVQSLDGPVALRSASSRPLASNAKPASMVDPFDLIGDTGPNDVSEPWDSESAEALTKVYEDSDAALVRRTPDADLKSAAPTATPMPVMMTSPSPAPVASVAAPVRDNEVERAWLDNKLSNIAIRIEQSLADVRPDGSVLALGERFSEFEHRVGNVLEDVATRSDVEGLRILEAQITGIATHLEHAEVQFGRLDGIEQQLQLVMDQLSDGRLSQLAARGARPVEDLEHLATAAAEQAASRFAATPKGGSDTRRFDEISDLLRTLTDERRQGEEQTYSMLDTVQQAMIRMLDRVDALEITQARAAVAPPALQPPPAPAAPAFAIREEIEDYAFERAATAAQPAAPTAAPATEPASVPIESAARPARASVDKLRQDFVADAQRAKMRAATESEAVSIRPKVSVQQATEQVKARAPIVGLDVDTGKQPVASRKLLVTAVVLGLVIAASGGSVLMSSRKPAPTSTAPLTINAEPVMPQGLVPEAKPEKPFAKIDSPPLLPAEAGGSAPGAEAVKPAGVPAAAAPLVVPERDVASKAAAPELAPATKPAGTLDTQSQALPPAKEPYRGNLKNPTVPQTSEEGLGMEMEVPDGEYMQQKDQKFDEQGPVTPEGIVLQNSDEIPAPEAIAHLRHQQATANLSSRVGSAAAKLTQAALMPEEVAKTRARAIAAQVADQAAGMAAPSAAAYVPEDEDVVRAPAADGPAGAVTSYPAADRRSSLSLPPATVGPLSLRSAAASGDPSAQFEVGARLAEGKGTLQNFKEAQTWYQRSAAQGFAQAQYRLGTLFERGLGAKADAGRARMWYQRAAEQGNVKAMHNLAVLSASRDAASPDYATAAQWFGQASEYGLADSQFNLAVLHENGLGVTKDMKQAYKWYALAAKSGDKEAIKRRDAAQGQLQADDLFDAEQLFESFQPKRVEALINDARTAGEDWKKRQALDDNG